MPQWTQAQREAIDARNSELLVSAAAGSGKTAVLVEHVLQLLREGGQISRLLIITFTRAAAAELRERLIAALDAEAAGNAHLRRPMLRHSPAFSGGGCRSHGQGGREYRAGAAFAACAG